jgi:glycosyltransferase involved in cell wall biosynthesis
VRVCFLTHYFPPEVGAPQTRIELLARSLAAAGHEVVVHTGFPHYPTGAIPPPYRNQLSMQERRDGIAIVRSAVYPVPNRGFTRRLANHASLALSALVTSRTTGPLDVVVAETPPLFTAAAGAFYAASKGAAFVAHVADRWPTSAVEMGALRNRQAIAAAQSLEHWVYRRADLVLAPTDGIVAALGELPVAGDKARRVWPVVDLERFTAAAPAAHDGPLRILYAGTVGLAHGLDTLVQAARLAGPAVAEVTIAGDGADLPRIAALAQDASNVRVLGSLPADQVPRLYAETDASAVLLRDLPVFAGALPTKMLEGLAAARPVLLSARGESARLLERAGAGVVVPPGDAPALAQACRRLQADPALRAELGRAGRRYAEANFGARRASEEWIGQLTDAVARHERSSRPAWRAAAGRRRAD